MVSPIVKHALQTYVTYVFILINLREPPTERIWMVYSDYREFYKSLQRYCEDWCEYAINFSSEHFTIVVYSYRDTSIHLGTCPMTINCSWAPFSLDLYKPILTHHVYFRISKWSAITSCIFVVSKKQISMKWQIWWPVACDYTHNCHFSSILQH